MKKLLLICILFVLIHAAPYIRTAPTHITDVVGCGQGLVYSQDFEQIATDLCLDDLMTSSDLTLPFYSQYSRGYALGFNSTSGSIGTDIFKSYAYSTQVITISAFFRHNPTNNQDQMILELKDCNSPNQASKLKAVWVTNRQSVYVEAWLVDEYGVATMRSSSVAMTPTNDYTDMLTIEIDSFGVDIGVNGIYKRGPKDKRSPLTFAMSERLQLGGNCNSNYTSVKTIDSLRVFNKGLSDSELLLLYQTLSVTKQ